MERELVEEYMDESIAGTAAFYDATHLPASISSAMYNYGSQEDYKVVSYVEVSETQGMIFTEEAIYFSFRIPDVIRYDEIERLILVKKEGSFDFYAKIKTVLKGFVFKNSYVNLVALVEGLSQMTDVKVEYEMTAYEKVEYFIPRVLNDLKEEAYEDIVLTKELKTQIKDIESELQTMSTLDTLDYQDECRALCRYALDFFDRLGLDSIEIDALEEAQQAFDNIDASEDAQLEGAKKWVDEMLDSYQKGDTARYDQLKQTMSNLGINEEALSHMSQEELDQYVQEMCKKFGISQSLFEKVKERFSK